MLFAEDTHYLNGTEALPAKIPNCVFLNYSLDEY